MFEALTWNSEYELMQFSGIHIPGFPFDQNPSPRMIDWSPTRRH